MNHRVISDLSLLPRIADSWTFLYTDKVRVERSSYSIELRDKDGRVDVPVAALTTLLLGPGSTITHAAVAALAESGCSTVWCGDQACRFYAAGIGETRRANHIEAQAVAWASKKRHMEVVRRLYALRFPEKLPDGLSLEQIRGHEGVRVREAYATLARETGVAWTARKYKPGEWGAADPLNRALSAANACLYGLCHAAIVSTGFSPALGFIHVGKQLSFVYDIADLYKVELTVPAAFHTALESQNNIESRVRARCRDIFYSSRLLERIVPDIQRVIGLAPEKTRFIAHRGQGESEQSGQSADEVSSALWNPRGPATPGGRNFGNPEKPATTISENDLYDDSEFEAVTVPNASDDEVPF